MPRPDPALMLDGRALAAWQQTVAEADMRGLDPPAAFGMQSGIAPMPDGSYIVAPQYFFAPGGASLDDGLWVANALQQAAQFSGGFQGALVRLMPVTYHFLTSVPMGVGQTVIGAGPNSTIINHAFTGDAFRQTFSGAYSGQTTVGGGVQNLVIDGTIAGPGSSGIHAGDIESLNYDRTFIRNFTGANSFGYLFDNTVNFTERMQGSIRAANNTIGVGFNVSGALTSTGSFARMDMDIFLIVNSAGQVGVQFNNGAFTYDHKLYIGGNISAVPSGTAPIALQIIGSVPAGHPGAGASSRIFNGGFSIGCEAGSGVVPPQSINFGASNVITDCSGVIDFAAGAAFTPSNNSGNLVRFSGPIDGDTSLRSQLFTGSQLLSAPGNGGTYFLNVVPFVISPSAGVTGMIIAAGGRPGQQAYIANSGTGSITFAAAGTSNVAGGVSVVIPAGQGAMFMWDTNTALWYCMGIG